MKSNKYILCCLIFLLALVSGNLFSRNLPGKCYKNNPSNHFLITSLFLKNTPPVSNNTFYIPYLNITKPVLKSNFTLPDFTSPLNYSGNSFFQLTSWNNTLHVNTIVTYQRKNTIFIMPYSVAIPVTQFPVSMQSPAIN